MSLLDRYEGALLGLAAGDALGTTLEFRRPGSFRPLEDIVGGGPFGLRPGQWTDDTSLALCLAESLLECNGFDPVDQLRRYLRWRDEGHWSSTGECFDVGTTTSAALDRFARTGEPWCTDPWAAGNGSLMRLAPVPLFFARDPAAAVERAGDSSRTTHGAPAAVDACRYFGGLLVGALRGEAKEALLAERYAPVPGVWDARPLHPEVDAVARGSFRREPPAIRGEGYVVKTLEAALWAFARGRDFRECCLLAANLGDDADTVAAVCGQIAGAFFGAASIPANWRRVLALADRVLEFARRLYRAAGVA